LDKLTLAASAMKLLLFINIVISLSCLENKHHISTATNRTNANTTKLDTFQVDCTLPNLDSSIVRRDTIIDYPKYKGHLIKSYDSRDRLKETEIINLYENDSRKMFSATEIYDTIGHLIFENKTKEFISWHCYKYTYDKMGHLVSKSGFSSGEVGVKISYFYDGDRLIKEITERAGEKTEKNY
jgi:hypothetical protein